MIGVMPWRSNQREAALAETAVLQPAPHVRVAATRGHFAPCSLTSVHKMKRSHAIVHAAVSIGVKLHPSPAALFPKSRPRLRLNFANLFGNAGRAMDRP